VIVRVSEGTRDERFYKPLRKVNKLFWTYLCNCGVDRMFLQLLVNSETCVSWCCFKFSSPVLTDDGNRLLSQNYMMDCNYRCWTVDNFNWKRVWNFKMFSRVFWRCRIRPNMTCYAARALVYSVKWEVHVALASWRGRRTSHAPLTAHRYPTMATYNSSRVLVLLTLCSRFLIEKLIITQLAR